MKYWLPLAGARGEGQRDAVGVLASPLPRLARANTRVAMIGD